MQDLLLKFCYLLVCVVWLLEIILRTVHVYVSLEVNS